MTRAECSFSEGESFGFAMWSDSVHVVSVSPTLLEIVTNRGDHSISLDTP